MFQKGHGWIIVALLLSVTLGASMLTPFIPATQAATAVPEGRDYATEVWQNPWDMSEYGDVSQYINNSGQVRNIKDVNVSNGVFSANGDLDPQFYPLFPGYIREPQTGSSAADPKAIQVGMEGVLRPINSATYRCLNFAMNLSNAPFQSGNPAQMIIYWFKDQRQNNEGQFPGAVWGSTAGKPLVLPRTGNLANSPSGWTLYSYNLSNETLGQGNTAWNASPTWAGLRIDPVQEQGYAGARFEVDWVRLTDCAENNVTVSWNGGGNALYVRPQGTDRAIFIKTVSGNSTTFDANKLAAGSYDICIGSINAGTGADNGNPCATVVSTPLVINQRPTGTFAAPAYGTGQDYATSLGNPWDFSDAADASVRNANGSYAGGNLTVVTPSGPLPAGSDAQLLLNTPGAADPAQYRYLTFKLNTSWRANWQNTPDGMIGRWIWSIQGTSGRVGFRCTLVSWDIPYDIGQQVYTVDLHNALNGRAEESQGECPSPLPSWKTSGAVLGMRFDPNENISVVAQANKPSPGGDFIQVFDYIRLTKDITVRSGQTYDIVFGANKGGVTPTFYYTTDRNDPTQSQATAAAPPAPGTGDRKTFAPVVVNGIAGAVELPSNALTFRWSTGGVAPGTYYVCARLNDGVQSTDVCSAAPVVITG
jgi:hypothetical protein